MRPSFSLKGTLSHRHTLFVCVCVWKWLFSLRILTAEGFDQNEDCFQLGADASIFGAELMFSILIKYSFRFCFSFSASVSVSVIYYFPAHSFFSLFLSLCVSVSSFSLECETCSNTYGGHMHLQRGHRWGVFFSSLCLI